MDRIKTGIYGLDDLIEGGIPKGRSMLISGATGTGKSIFCLQYLYKGAVEFGEPGIYVTLDERPDLLRQDMLRFGWDLQAIEDQGLLRIIDGSIGKVGIPSEEEFSIKTGEFDLDKVIFEIMKATKDIGAKRAAIDSIPAMGMYFKSNDAVRNAVLKLSYTLMRTGLTSLLTTEIDAGSGRFSKYGVEEFVVDGVILLSYLSGLGASSRTLLVRKMRATKHTDDTHPLSITNAGIQIQGSGGGQQFQEGI